MYRFLLFGLLVGIVRAEEKVLEKVSVNKCCSQYEVMLHNRCTNVTETNTTEWSPVFTNERGETNIHVDFKFVIGEPDCGSAPQWPILHYQNSSDRLILLPNGVLRHYAYRHVTNDHTIYDLVPTDDEDARFFDYPPGQYCLDKNIDVQNHLISQYALICTPDSKDEWQIDKIMKKIIDPVFHGFAIICYLIVAIVYFILPTLRDLVGNIITTISVCMIVSQAADMVRIFTEFSSHVSFMVADIICYTSLLGAFFWLNSLGYYIWRTFRSRNVFLRVTDGKKYCYYSGYAWSCTIVMGVIAVFAHFTLEIPKSKKSVSLLHNQEVIGPLGIGVFFTPVAFTILVNIFFYATTLQIINRLGTYGRIHHKLKHSFRMFLMVFMIMTLTWLFLLLSWLNYEILQYIYIVINAIHAPIFLYVCILNQKHVAGLLKKTCCFPDCVFPCCRPENDGDWGDEMTAMDSGIY